MAGFKVQKLTAGAIAIDDLGLTLTGAISTIVDITDIAPENLARSADLLASITADEILIVDPRDDTNATILTKAESTNAVNRSNDTHFGISGGRFGGLDDPTVSPGADFIIQYNSSGDVAEYINPDDFMSNQSASIGTIVGAMGQDGTDTTFSYNATAFPLIAGQDETNYDGSTNNGAFAGTATAGAYVVNDVITMSDGSTVTVDAVSTGDITAFTVTTSSGANTTAGVTLTQASVLPANGQTGFTITPEQNNISQGTLQWDVDDSFLRNTGDVLDSGTLQIASGAALDLPAGSTITIAGNVTEASIQTPSGGFANNDDLINKEYVDSIAGGFDYKESVRIATTPSDLIGGVIAAQDETNYDGAGSNGSFVGGDGVGGTAYVATDTITLIDGTVITVDAVDGNGDVTDFTVTTAGTSNTDGQVLTQASTSGSGTGFTITLGTNNIGGVYATSPSNGQFTGVDLSSGTGITIDGLNFTGVSTTGLVIGDRVLIKDQTDATQNGIYFIDAGSTAANVTLTRSTDMDGTPASEVSGGNTTYVEDTTTINGSTVNSNSRWSVVWDGDVTLNTDPVDWTQTGSGSISTAGIGLSASGATIDLDVDDLTTATVVATDTIAFHDANGGAQPSGSQTRKSTFQSVFDELDVPNNITSNGFIVRTANDTYAARSITVNGAGPLDGLAVSNGDGVSADPVLGLDIQNLPARAAVDTADLVPVWDSSTNSNVYYSVNDIAGAASASNSFETWARAGNGSGGSLVADSATDTVTLSGGIGIDLDTVPASDTITFTFTDSGMADTAITTADTIPFFDTSNSGEAEFRTVSSLITDLGLATLAFTTIAGDSGTAVADTATDTLNLTGATSGGITTIASDGPETVTFAITGADLATGSATLATGDFIIVNDSTDVAGTVSQKYTFADMIADLSLLTSAYATVGGDSGSATASGSDTINMVGGTNGGITTTASQPGTDQVAFDITPVDLATGSATLVGGDFIIVSDSADTATTVAQKYTFTDVITDLGLLTAVTASVDEDLLGIDVTSSSIIGLDILGLTNPAENMAATDEFAVHNKSEGTAGANRKMTGQEMADGTATILGIETLTFDTFGSQTLLAYTDSGRSKVLSVESHTFQWSDNKVSDNDWLRIGQASDADSGWVMPYDGTLVGMTAHTENTGGGNTFDIDLYIDAVDSGPIATLTGGANAEDTDTTLDINFAAGDKLRLRADQTAGTGDMGDVTVALLVKWRS